MSSRRQVEIKTDDTTSPEPAEPAEVEASVDLVEEQAPPCGASHPLPLLAHVTCQEPTGHEEGEEAQQHRAVVQGALYVW